MTDILYSVDQFLNFVPLLLRVMFWACLGGYLAILIYWQLSNQDKIAELKAAVKEQRTGLLSDDIDFEQYQVLAKQSLISSLKLIQLVIVPTVISALPLLFFAHMLHRYYAHSVLLPLPVSWMSGWEFCYFVTVFVSAFFFKFLYRVH